MKHTILLATLVLLVFYALPAAMGRSVAFTHIAPPVPASLIEKIDEQGHPFLLAQRSRFREARSLLNNTFFEERGDRFTYRVNGYLDPETPWYIGEGPLQDNPDFHPSMLPETDFRFYAQVLCEAMAFYGIDHAQWSRRALIREMERLLDEIEFGYIVNEQALSQPAITQKHMAMFSLTALLYDMIYHRIDTKDRHALNDRFKRERDRLALYCKSKSINNLPPNQRALLGSALGLSTLMCISIYPHEWANTGLFSIQSFLPDIYRAVNLTRDGFDELVARDGQIRCRFHDLELLTLLATPWIECMNALGYPYAIKPGGYTKLVAALEQHRLKGTLQLLEPVDSRYIQDPWIPKTVTIYEPDNPINYPEDEKDGKVVRVKRRDTTFEQKEEDETSKTAKKPDPMMGIRNPESITINQIQTGTRLTLREQIEKLSLPRPTPTPTPLVPVEDRPNWQAGWSRPKKVTPPGVLGVLYLQAAKENPDGAAAVAWEARFWEEYQHPYAFLYYKSLPAPGYRETVKRQCVHYPDSNFSLFSLDSYRGSCVVASQAAVDTVVASTITLTHDSFLLAEEETQWQWFHNIQSATPAVANTTAHAAIDTATAAKTIASASQIEYVTPIISSLFTVWMTDSPVGETLVVRRGRSVVGSPYTLVAHNPIRQKSTSQVEDVFFSLEGNKIAKTDAQVESLFSLVPPAAQTIEEPLSLQDRMRIQRARRRNKIKTPSTGILRVLFSSNTLDMLMKGYGKIGPVYQAQLAQPDKPFFYTLTLKKPGRHMYTVKYPDIPIPGTRILEWPQGIEMIVFDPGKDMKNPFVKTDADLVIVTRDRSMKGLFYLMINGSYLSVKFAPSQRDYFLLADTKGRKVSCAWSDRRVYLSNPPRNHSVFHAPGLVNFECPNTMIKYKRRDKQVMVWSHSPRD